MKLLLLLHLLLLSLFAYEKSSDAKNFYLVSQHFRAIIGVEYSDSSAEVNLATKYLDIAENVWQKEVVELKFLQPKNSQNKKIDIYMANHSAYNYEGSVDENISANYAGYATEYASDGTPYFLLNPSMREEIVKVTIAHEFFHTLQYAYFNSSLIPDNVWIKNIWWIEATAVLMEDEVYDNVNDYVHFLSPFFNASYKSFEIYDGSHEYAMAIFAKYIKEKYGFDIIKKSFITLSKNYSSTFYDILNTLLQKDYHTNMQKTLQDFTKWVANPSAYFEEGASYPRLKHFSTQQIASIDKGGLAVVDNLQDGWNMVTLTTSQDLNATSNDTLGIVWSYENGIWKNSTQNQIKETNSSKGYWVKVSKPSSLNYTYYDKSTLPNITNMDNQWHLFGLTRTTATSTIANNNEILLWQYNKGTWSVYSNNQELQKEIDALNLTEINKLNSFVSYWIKKI